MKKKINTIIIKDKEILDLANTYTLTIESRQYLHELIQELCEIESKYRPLILKAEQSTKGATIQNGINRQELITLLFVIMTRINQYAIKKNKVELEQNTKISRNQLEKTPAALLLTKAEETLITLDKMPHMCQRMEITNALIDELTIAKTNYKQGIVKAAHIAHEVQTANQNLKKLYEDNCALIDRQIAPAIKAEFSESNTHIYKAFKAILRQNKVQFRKLALVGKIIDDKTNTAISNAKIISEELNIDRRIKSTNGTFRVNNVEEGPHTLTCIHPNYITKHLSFTQVWGNTTQIEIRMTPNPPNNS